MSSAFPLQWIDAFETGDPEIDAQHREIVEALKGVAGLLSTEAYDAALGACRHLRQLLAWHNEFEERRLQELGFPRLTEHMDLHRKFKGAVGQLLGECRETCSRCLELDCVKRLTEAVVRGELIADVDYKSFLQEQSSD